MEATSVKTLETVMREMRESDEWMTVDAGYQAGRKGQIKMTLAALQPVRDALWGLHDKLREQAGEMESPYWKKEPEQPDWDYMAKAIKEIASDVAAILGEREG